MRELSNEELNEVSGGEYDSCWLIRGGATYEHGYIIPQPGGGNWECFNGIWIIT